jgi:hypothetical protein
MCMCVYTCVCVCVNMYVCVCVCVCKHVCVCVWVVYTSSSPTQIAATPAQPIPPPPALTNRYTDPRTPYSWGLAAAFSVMFNRTTPTNINSLAISALTLSTVANSMR